MDTSNINRGKTISYLFIFSKHCKPIWQIFYFAAKMHPLLALKMEFLIDRTLHAGQIKYDDHAMIKSLLRGIFVIENFPRRYLSTETSYDTFVLFLLVLQLKHDTLISANVYSNPSKCFLLSLLPDGRPLKIDSCIIRLQL